MISPLSEKEYNVLLGSVNTMILAGEADEHITFSPGALYGISILLSSLPLRIEYILHVPSKDTVANMFRSLDILIDVTSFSCWL